MTQLFYQLKHYRFSKYFIIGECVISINRNYFLLSIYCLGSNYLIYMRVGGDQIWNKKAGPEYMVKQKSRMSNWPK